MDDKRTLRHEDGAHTSHCRANAERHGRGKSVPPDPFGSLCSGSCGFPCSDSGVTRIPAFAPCGRRYAESSDILHCLTRISRKRGLDPEETKD